MSSLYTRTSTSRPEYWSGSPREARFSCGARGRGARGRPCGLRLQLFYGEGRGPGALSGTDGASASAAVARCAVAQAHGDGAEGPASEPPGGEGPDQGHRAGRPPPPDG